MASRRRTATPVVESNDVASFPIRAWQGLYHLFGARVERFDVTPEGVTAINFTMPEKDANTVLEYIVRDEKARVPLFPAYFWLQGEAPAPFSSSAELTIWQTQNVVAGDKNRRPKFIKDAIQDYKNSIGIAVPRGRPRKHFKLEIGQIDTSALEASDLQELEKLQETIERVRSTRETVEA